MPRTAVAYELEAEWEEELEPQLSPTRLLSCTPAERNQVARALGRRAISVAEVRRAVGGAVAQATREARNAARLLRARPRAPRTTQVFRGVFNVRPTFVPAWRPANATWRDLGDLVALRLERAAGILSGGYMRFFCWGSVAHCPECTDPPTAYRACSSYRGRYHVCIGREWWQWWRQGRRGFMATTMLHEALHIYFRLQHHLATPGRPSVGNVYCYATLVARLHRRAPNPGNADACRTGRQY
jgi:hypothetical protein